MPSLREGEKDEAITYVLKILSCEFASLAKTLKNVFQQLIRSVARRLPKIRWKIFITTK
jgi:hypothetical protein